MDANRNPKPRRGRLLLVEDERPLRQLLTHYLRYLGYDVTPSEELEEAEALLEVRCFDALVTDLGLGNDDPERGLDVLSHARYRSPSIRVLVLTGLEDPILEIECRRRGADEFLSKPVSLGAVASALERLLTAERRPCDAAAPLV